METGQIHVLRSRGGTISHNISMQDLGGVAGLRKSLGLASGLLQQHTEEKELGQGELLNRMDLSSVETVLKQEKMQRLCTHLSSGSEKGSSSSSGTDSAGGGKGQRGSRINSLSANDSWESLSKKEQKDNIRKKMLRFRQNTYL